MLRNYLRIAHRTLLKNKVFSFINIFGLAVGMAAFLFIIQYVRFERSYESFNPNADNIYRITLDLYNGSEYVVTDCETHAPMGPLLKEKMPEVIDYARMFHNDGLQDIEIGEQKFLGEGIYFADTSAFRIFSLEPILGDKHTALSGPFQAVVTESTAKKYFGHTEVVGEAIKIESREYHVAGVIADLPPNTHLKFDILLSHNTLYKIYPEWYKDDNWGGNNEYTYLLMAPGTDLAAFNKKLTALCVSLKVNLEDDRYTAEPMKDIHLYSNKTFEPEVNGNARAVYFLLIIAVFIIVIAWVNYVNLSTARAIERAREVGIRKVMGSLKVQLVFQFLSESIIVNLIAAIVAFVLFQVGLPFFRELTGQPLSLDIVTEPSFWSLFLVLFLIGSVLSGLYPALVLSSFQPSTVLKGKFQSSSHGQQLRKGLVIFQFAATVILMICMCTVYLQINHMRTHDLGMNIDQTLVLRGPHENVSDSTYQLILQTFKNELLRHPEIQLVARSESVPGLSLHELSTTSNVKRVGQSGEQKNGGSYNYYSYSIDADFIAALNMELVAGRNFEAGTANHDLVIINEDAVYKLGFSNVDEALGSKLTYRTRGNGESSTIIGVLRNFYQRSPKEPHIPMILRYRERADYFSIRLKTGQVHETLASVKTVWDRVFPNSVFHYFFLDENYDHQYQADTRFGSVIATFSGLAVFIACLGLFGLSSFTIVQRTKEIGIRKVLGASVGQIVHLLSQDFMKVVMLAALLALPVAYFAMEEWLSGYAVRISLSGWIFALPVVMILLISLLTVSIQTIRSALANPVDSLKQE